MPPHAPPMPVVLVVPLVAGRDAEDEVEGEGALPRVEDEGVYQSGAGVSTAANFCTHVLSIPNAIA